MSITFFVEGIPVAQPRVKAAMRGKHVHIYTPDKKPKDARKMSIGQWKDSIRNDYADELGRPNVFEPPKSAPFSVVLLFYIPRPSSHFGTGKNSSVLKASAPKMPTSKPDIDNYIKAVLDALTTSRVWNDDSQVVCVRGQKEYTVSSPGVFVTIQEFAA